jgi:hypothetical protein
MLLGPASGRTAQPSSEVDGFRERLWATAGTACGSDHARLRWYAIGGWPVCVRFASPAIEAALADALAHLESGPRAGPTLTVSAWDDWSTGAFLPAPPRSGRDGFGVLGALRGAEGGDFRAAFDVSTGTFGALDLRTGHAVYRVPDARRVSVTDRAAPLRTILHWWAGAQGALLVHAGAVGRPDGAVLLIGRGGAGKSTTALACLHSLGYVGDDYCLLRFDVEPRVFSLYATAKVDAGTIRRLPHLTEAPGHRAPGSGKEVVFVGARWPDRMLPVSPVRAIVLPKVTDRARPRLRPARGGEGLLAVAPSTMFQLPGLVPEALGQLAALARRVPTYVLEVGDDLDGVAGCLEACLDPARAPTGSGADG